MNRSRLTTALCDDAELIRRGRMSHIHSARKQALDELRSACQSVMNGSAGTAAIRAACDDLDWLASLDSE